MGMNNDHMEIPLHTCPAGFATGERSFRLMLALVPAGEWPSPGDPERSVGYILQHGEPVELLAALRAMANGNIPGPERIGRRVSFRMLPDTGGATGDTRLTGREADVLRGLVDGLSYKMVADHLGISFETVRSHIKRVYKKLSVRSSTEAVAKALKSGLVA